MANVTIPRKNIAKIDIVYNKGGLTASQVYKKYKPDYMINLALYDMDSGENIVYLEDENEKSGYLFANEGIAIQESANLLWTTKDIAFASKDIRDYVSGSPTLVKNGKAYITWGNKISDYINGNHVRSFLGFNDSYLILCSSDNSLTIKELADTALTLGCQYAINCDGGGSCHLQQGNKILKRSLRKNASWFLVWLKQEEKEITTTHNYTVCLDAGHGKNTPGKRSFDSTLLEYEFNRDVTERIQYHLKRHGVATLLTAPDDIDTSLSDRCKIANKAKANIFVSVHANAGPGTTWSSANGWEIYVVQKGAQAEQLAKQIQNASCPYLGLKDRGIKEANFQVLRDTDMPAVLIEHGFYTNKTECELLKTDEFRKKCGIADAKGILAHLGIAWQEENAISESPTPPATDYKKQTQDRFGFDDNTMAYLSKHPYATDLFRKLATMK